MNRKLITFVIALFAPAALAQVRVQDVVHLQGQHRSRLQGFGLVVGLKGTGDGGKYVNTLRALKALHDRFQQPVFDVADLRSNNNVALVAVEVETPEFGFRSGQRVDVTVSVIGAAKSLAGGQLLTTPLQEATLSSSEIIALAGGQLDVNPNAPNRGVIRQGATFEMDWFHESIENGEITLVLDDAHASWTWARMLVRAINHEMGAGAETEGAEGGAAVVEDEIAFAATPQNVRIRIPAYELPNPASFISRVLQTPLFTLPEQAARVVISKSTKNISFTGSVTISPTVVQVAGLGTVSVGGNGGAAAKNGAPGVVAITTDAAPSTNFQQLLDTLSRLHATKEQMVEIVEQLYRSGTLHAQLVYEE